MQQLEKVINFFEEDRKTEVRGHGAKALYRFTSEYEERRMRLKLEINCKEHFNVLDWVEYPFEVINDWYTGGTKIRTYSINELLGTKMRALYQRSKGRDLFDMDKIVHCFKEYTTFATGRKPPSKKVFLRNIEEKENDPGFSGDMEALLGRDTVYNQVAAFEWLKSELIEKI